MERLRADRVAPCPLMLYGCAAVGTGVGIGARDAGPYTAGGGTTITAVTTDVPLRTLDNFLSKLFFGRVERRQRERAEFIEKLDAYLASATMLANALGSRPSNESRSSIGRSLDWLASKVDLLSTDAQDQMVGRWLFPKEHVRNEAMLREFVEAQTRLGTIAPDAVRSELTSISRLLVDWSRDPSGDRTDEWLEAARHLRNAADAYLRRRWWHRRRGRA